MAQVISRYLVDFLQERAGEYLRSVIHYDRDSHELLHLRRDVAQAYSDGEIDRVLEELRHESMDAARQEAMYVHGELGCVVRVFEAAVEMHFPHAGCSGTAIALDPEAATRLHSFVGECLDSIPEQHRPV